MDEMIDLSEGMEVTKSDFVVHPEDYKCLAHCQNIEFRKDVATGKVEAFIIKLDADGAPVTEYFGLVAKGKRTIDMIRGQLSAILVAFGIRKVGEKSMRLIDDINACVGQYGAVQLKVDKFQSNTTGKWLDSNKVKRWLSPEEFAKRHDEQPASKPSFDFG